MKFEIYFREFCFKYGYEGKYKYNKNSNEYEIIISKNDDNAGAFLSRGELQAMSNDQIISLLELLHHGFKEKFNK